jgi:hypothetical protein
MKRVYASFLNNIILFFSSVYNEKELPLKLYRLKQCHMDGLEKETLNTKHKSLWDIKDIIEKLKQIKTWLA